MAERANSRQLSGLVVSGEDLIRQAMRNPEFGVGHLEKWAEMLQILKDIAGNRMPSVADLLREAAQAPTGVGARPTSNNKSMMAGQRSLGRQGVAVRAEARTRSRSRPSGIPSIADRESSQQPPDEKADAAAAEQERQPRRRG